MKKVVLASMLAFASAAPMAHYGFAQAAAAAPAGGQIQMSADEYKAYNDANTAATPAAKAAGFEAYLKTYPNSAVKGDVLQQLVFLYSQQNDTAKTLDAADRLLQVDPNNLRALTFEVYLRRADADKLTDPAAKTAALDKVAAYAQTGLNATKPKDMSDADFETLKKAAMPTFQSAIADDAISKKDSATAISALKAEITGVDVAQTQAPGTVLQDFYILSQAYLNSTPPDYLNCAWFAARGGAFAPEPFKTEFNKLGSYCYVKYHGQKEGYDKLQAQVQTVLLPPADLSTTVKPAPKPEDIVSNLISTTPDLATLAISDKEFVLQYGKQADADKVFDTVKGKSVTFPDAVVIEATADTVKAAVTEDAQQSKTADFSFTMKEPLKTVPTVGNKVTLSGTYASYTQSPLLITMTDASVVEKKAPTKTPARTPAKRPAVRRR